MKRLALLTALLATFNAHADDPEISISAIDSYSIAPLTAIKVGYAYDTLKLTGAGMRVGVLDTGLKLGFMTGSGDNTVHSTSGMVLEWDLNGGGIGGSGHALSLQFQTS